MSTYENMKNWFRNWRGAKDKQRENLDKNDLDAAIFWANVALAIETGFRIHFGTDISAVLTGGLT